MADIAINYELLRKLGTDTQALKQRLEEARQRHPAFVLDDVGIHAAPAIAQYYTRWNGAFKNAQDLLEALSSTYTTVGTQWFNQDAQYAANAAQQGALQRHSIWANEKHAYETWEKLSQTYVTGHAWDKDGNMYTTTEPLADPTKPPPKPGEEPTSYSYTANGRDHTTSMTYDANGDLASLDTKITGSDGATYHEHTTFGPNGGYTTVVDNADGTKVTETVTGNPDGTGSRTVTTTDTDGKETTKTYSGTGVANGTPTWTQTGDSAAGPDGSGGADGETHRPPPGGSGTARKY